MAIERTFTRDFAIFVDDLGGLIWSLKAAGHSTWKDMAAEVNCAQATITRLASRKTKNPTLYTCWKVLKGLDHSSVIRHSQLEQYRGISKPVKKAKAIAKVIAMKRRVAA